MVLSAEKVISILPGERRTPGGREVTTADSSSAVTFQNGSAVPKRSRNTVRLAWRSASLNFELIQQLAFVHTGSLWIRA